MSKKLISLLLLFASACSFQVQMVTPQPLAASTPVEAQPSSAASVASPLVPSPTAIVNPTDAFFATKTPTDTAEPPKISGAYPIRFALNGTFVDIVDSISAGTSKTYSVNALKGQVMSVSIHQGSDGDWTVVPMQITGADGSTLCMPQGFDTACYFWRGVLPASQDYFITLTPSVDMPNFTLRVAIDPPGTITQSFQYTSLRQDATFSYSDEFAPVRFPGPQVYKAEPELALALIDTNFYTNTNLVEAYLLFDSTNQSDILKTCTDPVSFGGPERVTGEVHINGHKFVRSEGSGVGAGNIYEQIYHRAAINGYCYEVTFFIHYGNIGNYLPDSGVKEFDHDALLKKFEAILSTLVIK